MSANKKARNEGLSLQQAQKEFHGFIQRIEEKELSTFLQWIDNTYSEEKEKDRRSEYAQEAMEVLREISNSIRNKVPLSGELESEKINFPTVGHDSDCNIRNTIHVDSFLYDEDDVENLVKEGKISRNYCLDCGSKKTKPLTFISHSMAPEQLEFIFTRLVPLKEQKEGFHVVDIGSRLGAVIYAASLFGGERIQATGIEINKELCKLQTDAIREFGLQNVNICCSDVRCQKEIISAADMIVMNNVFSFFMSLEEQVACWEFMKQNVKKGCFILHNPSVIDVIDHLDLPFNIEEWLEEISTSDHCLEFTYGNEDLFADCATIYFYRVK